MPKPRSHRLLCPIARALDRVGDRWTLLILRDLHAGPARFSDLLAGLPGLATNLLATRLQQLQEDGLVLRRAAEHGAWVYALTARGEATAPLLFELATLGTRFPAPEDVRRPGNLRTVAVTLKEALRRVVDDAAVVHAELVVDDEHFAIDVEDGRVDVRYRANPDAPVSIETDYETLVAVGDGAMTLAEFAEGHVEVKRGSQEAVAGLLGWMARAFAPTADRELAGRTLR